VNRTPKFLTAVLGFLLMMACGPKASTTLDQSLATDIQAKLYSNDTTRAANIKVSVANGVVTLSGDVPNSDAALQAMTVANNTTGIKSVNNQMKVADSAASAVVPPPQNLAATPQPANVPPLGGPAPMGLAPVAPPAPVAPNPAPLPPPAAQTARAEPRPERVVPPTPPPPVRITIPAGVAISVRMIEGIDTGHNHEGETFRASLSAPITHGDRVVVPVGAGATVLLTEAKGAGRIKGSSALELRVTSIVYRGERVPIETGVYEAKGNARGKQTAIRTGIGAAAGALIGGLAGGGKGAGIGAAAGGGAGVGLQLLTHGKQIKIPSETEIGFTLAAPVVLTR
jgi:hypothetical protein